MKITRSLVAGLSGLLPLVGGAQTIHIPLDAIGNVRSSIAPYVPPATRPVTFTVDRLQLHLMAGLPTEWLEVKEFRNGGDAVARKIPGAYHVSDLTIRGQYEAVKPILKWFDDFKVNPAGLVRKDVFIDVIILKENGDEGPLVRLKLHQAWPHQVNYSPVLDKDVTIQIAFEYMQRVG